MGRWDVHLTERKQDNRMSEVLTVAYLMAIARSHPEDFARLKQMIAKAEKEAL